MIAAVGIRTPGAVRLGAGLAVAPGAALPTAACGSSGSGSSGSGSSGSGSSGSGSSSAAASSAGWTASRAAAAVGSGLVITAKSGAAGAFLTDGSGCPWANDGKDSSARSGPGRVSGQDGDGFGAKRWLVDPAGTSITSGVTVSSCAPAPAGVGGGY